MAKNNKEYWQKREEEKLNKGIKDCNKLAKELQSHYKKAYKEIEKEINNLFEKYAKDNELTYAEANKYLGKKQTHIADVCGGKRNNCCGYIWKYAS